MVIRKRLDVAGPALVFVTTTVRNWIPVFSDDNAAICIIGQLRESIEFYHCSLVGYVLMPSHLHLLLRLPDLRQLSVFMESFKSLSSRKIKQLHLDTYRNLTTGAYHLWKPRFDDIVIKSEKQFRIKLDYIHNNPVKSGFVISPTDWRFSSAGDWLDMQPGLIPIDKEYGWLEKIEGRRI